MSLHRRDSRLKDWLGGENDLCGHFSWWQRDQVLASQREKLPETDVKYRRGENASPADDQRTK